MNSKSFADPLNKNDKNITADGPPNPADGSPNPVDGQPNPADGQSKPVNGQLSPADEKPSLADALERLDKPALISIILQYANQHRPMKDMLLLQLSERISAADYAGRLVKASIQNAAKRGFVEAACVGDAIEGARIAGDLAAAKYRDGRFFDCAGIYAAMLGETVALLAYCDDSGGRVTGIIDETMERLEALLAAIPPGHPDTGKIFDLTLGHALERFYDEWGERRAAILTACIPLCREMALRDKLTAYLLSVQERKNARQAYYAGLSVAAAQKIMLILIRTYDGDGAAEDYIGQNLVNSDFRKMAIEKALAAGRLEQVLTLCLEGEALNAKDKGQVSVWRHIRYDVYEKQNNILALKELAFEFTLNGEFPYYLRLKELYADGEGGDGGDGGEALSPVSTGEWPAVLAGLLQALESEWQSPVYIKILIHEKNQPKLLACCRKNVPSIVQLYPHLIPERAGEVDELFVEYIRYKAERASGRGDYQDVGGIICHYGKACGWNAADRIIRELLSLYRGRPAFVDELKKAKNTR